MITTSFRDTPGRSAQSVACLLLAAGEVPPQPRTGTSLAAPAGLGLSAFAAALNDGPWWITALLICAASSAVLVQTVFPQESADRLEWWRDRRRIRTRAKLRRHIARAGGEYGRLRQ